MEPLPAHNSLALRSPQQCLAGRYCSARAASSSGTGLCPAGKFCSPGAPEPEEAPEGVFVGEAGQVRGTQCFPGQFAPMADSPVCYECPAGASCPEFGTTTPFICAPGTFREPPINNGSATTISCTGCGPGTWAPWRGTPDFSSCEPCPQGRVCPVGTGNVSMGTECPEGHICGEGTTPDRQTSEKCYSGFYCASSTTPETVWRFLCVAGFYCDLGTTFAVRYKFRCKLGFYCPTGTGYTRDLDRPHVTDTVYVGKRIFYLMQKVAQFCTRQRMMLIAEGLRRQRLTNLELGLPPLEEIEIRANFEAWKKEFINTRYCQHEAVHAVYEVTGESFARLEQIQSMDFLETSFLRVLSKHAADHTNKCIDFNPHADGENWPQNDCPSGDPCRSEHQLQCLCTTTDLQLMLVKCFGDGYPEPSCVEESGQTDSFCLDRSLDFDGNIPADDFDLMAGHHLQYVMASIEEEMKTRYDAGEGSKTRCPFGTMTHADGKRELRDCDRRVKINYLQESIDMIVGTVNPLNSEMSAVNWTTSAGDPTIEETFRPVFSASAGSVFLVTFDVRHLPLDMRYGEDWRVKFFLNETLAPEEDDPIQCDSMLYKEIAKGPNRRPDKSITVARMRRCNELKLPPSWIQEVIQGPVPAGGGVFTFMLHPLVDCMWRVEIQIINGKFLADRFMLVRTAVVEAVAPSRTSLGSNRLFAMQVSSSLKVELPTNMPLKTWPEDGSQQEVITKAFLNWLPFQGELMNYMRAPVRNGEREYTYTEKRFYFQDKPQVVLPYLPYFSNCRGFGRTLPLWALLEQSRGCAWVERSLRIAELSLGAEAVGDSCNGVQVECLLDEIPNVKMPLPRWFEAPSGSVLFHILREPVEAEALLGFEEAQSAEPVYLIAGVTQKGSLPKKVSLVLQYWQRTPTTRVFAQGRAYYSDFVLQPDEEKLRGNAKWNYTLEVFYFPMTHFEVMVSFAFPFHFYFALYNCIGIICAGMVLVLWVYHRFLSHLPFPPKLLDKRYVTCIMVPLFRGSGMAFAVMFTPMFIGLGLIRGNIAEFRFPFVSCPEGALPDNCFLGVLDFVQSSYGGESAVTKTTYGQRRTGRTGIILAVMGGYATMVALKLFILPTESRYYQREDKTSLRTMKDMIGDDSSDDPADERKSGRDSEFRRQRDNEDDNGLMPIFTTHLWKRSCLALLMYANAILQQCVLQWSYSSFFRRNVIAVLVCLHLLRSVLKLAVTDYMCETMLVVPIHTVSQVTYLVSLLATPTLFDFLTAYIVVSGIQMIDRVYVSPMEDFVIGKVMRAYRNIARYIEWIRSLRRQTEREPEDDQDSEDELAMAQGTDPSAGSFAVESERQTAEAEGDTEDMIGFCVSLSTDAVGNLLAPLFFALCAWLYDESQILSTYGIRIEHAAYYVVFYAVQFVFQFITDILSINTVELFHGWHVTDYLEYCMYRFKIRTHDWKGRETVYDETLAPHQRSVDQMCFSDQFYFMNTLCGAGILAWMFGMQVIFVNQWNLFDDPATPIVMFGGLAICVGAHVTTTISASYLKVWMVNQKHASANKQAQQFLPHQVLEAKKKLEQPRPPPGTAHEGWAEPPPYDKKGLERYRMAFLRENQLWLQAAFADLEDKKVIVEQREALLEQLASLINEMPPSNFAPTGADGEGDDGGLRFGEVPPVGVARAAQAVQRETYEGSMSQEIMKMWKERAQFMLHLKRITDTVKLDNKVKRNSCELCGRTEVLEVMPIYTLLHLASSYRQQRDMSPLWNAPLWRHFYQTFTPTCTLCDSCAAKHHRMNTNIPIDESRFQRLQAQKKTVYSYVMESSTLPVTPIDAEAIQILRCWLGWTRALVSGEEPGAFLPRFGFEGRTPAELRKQRICEAEATTEKESLPSLSSDHSEEPEGEEEEEEEEEEKVKEVPKQREIKDVRLIDLDEPEPPSKALVLKKPLTWSEMAIMKSWLQRARDRMQAPQLSDWSRPLPLPPGPQLPPPPPGPVGRSRSVQFK